jgi:glycosyltransferase involved in cell wall biosynthesis
MKKLLVHAWPVDKVGSEYFLPYTHMVYLCEMVKYYDCIILLSPVNKNPHPETLGQNIAGLNKVQVYELPYSGSYVSAIPFFFQYLKAYFNLRDCTRSYVRYPVAFGWLSWFFFRNKHRIVHFVGDPIQVTMTNPNYSLLKKILLIFFFMPEHIAYLISCYGTRVFTNGKEIQEKLRWVGIKAEAVISTTLTKDDFHFDGERRINKDSIKLLYVGYLRKWKGIEMIIEALGRLRKNYPDSKLTIVGSGEFENNLKQMAGESNLGDFVRFEGHIEDRQRLNNYFRTHDLFCHTSAAEGSPRAVLEAMANGISVIATPVGSLPFVFANKKEIFYVPFGKPQALYQTIEHILLNPSLEIEVREKAFQKSKSFAIEEFIKNIFK